MRLCGGEKIFLWVLLAAWVAPAWWLGASGVAGQGVLLGLSAVAFVLACARRWSAAGRGARVGCGEPGCCWWWCGGAGALFLLFILAQGLNPAFGFEAGWPVGRLFEIPHLEWLPSGMATPFSAAAGRGDGLVPFENAWRYLMIFGGVALLVAATALGVDRWVLVRRWVEVMVLHAVCFSVVSLAHNVSGSRLVFWVLHDPANRLGGPVFPNGNQQGAYQVMLLALALAAAWMRGDARPFPALRGRRGWLCAAAGVVWLAGVSGRHRAGIVLSVVLLLFALAPAWWRAREGARWRIAAAGACGAAALAAGVAVIAPLRETVSRFAELRADGGAALLHGGGFRAWQHEVALKMWGDAPVFGRGGGCYLYLYNGYYGRVPGLARELGAQRLNRIVFPHADGDWVEFLAEYGCAGVLLFVMPLACWLVWLAGRARRAGPEVWVLAAGMACVLAQAWVDPALRNPAVLSALAGAGWLAVRVHARLEGKWSCTGAATLTRQRRG